MIAIYYLYYFVLIWCLSQVLGIYLWKFIPSCYNFTNETKCSYFPLHFRFDYINMVASQMKQPYSRSSHKANESVSKPPLIVLFIYSNIYYAGEHNPAGKAASMRGCITMFSWLVRVRVTATMPGSEVPELRWDKKCYSTLCLGYVVMICHAGDSLLV